MTYEEWAHVKDPKDDKTYHTDKVKVSLPLHQFQEHLEIIDEQFREHKKRVSHQYEQIKAGKVSLKEGG